MKKYIVLLILSCFLIFPGCARKDSPPQSAEINQQQAEQVTNHLQRHLGIEEDQPDDIAVSRVDTYGDETVVRYVQTCRGIEVYGSSMVASSADKAFLGGTYYDLTDAFGADFSALAEDAAQVPEWMVSYQDEKISITFDTDSLRPVIFITDENTAAVARCFTAEMTYAGETVELELVTDPEGSTVYAIRNLAEVSGYDHVTVKNGKTACEFVEDSGTVYAYNEEYNFYLVSTTYDRSSDVKLDDYCRYRKDLLMYQGYGEPDTVYSWHDTDWSSGERKNALNAMSEVYQVADWYYQNFRYWCIDNMGGLGVVILCDEVDGTAKNANSVMILLSPEVVNAPEILAHEYGHAVYRYFTMDAGTLMNQTAALSEAVCDVFGAVYERDDWVLGDRANLKEKDIPGTYMTMDDYIYDRSSDYAWYSDVPYEMDLWETLKFAAFGGLGYELESSQENYHDNAFIVSHTLYRFWKEDLNRDYDKLGQILYRSLRYLPANADFQDFRSAFVHAARLLYGQSVADDASEQFDEAGIYLDLAGEIKKVMEARQNPKYLLDYCTADFDTIFEAFEYSSYTTPNIYGDDSNVWNCACMMGQGLGLVFTFASDYEDPDATPIYATIDDYMYYSGSSTGLELTPGLKMGMTYSEAAQAFDLSELTWAPEQRWTEPVYLCYGGAADCALELYFIGSSEDSAVLVSVNATPVG